MADKSLTFQMKMGFDQASVDRTVSQLRNAQKDVYAASDLSRMHAQTAGRMSQAGYTGVMSSPKLDDVMKNRQKLDRIIEDMGKSQENIFKLMGSQGKNTGLMVQYLAQDKILNEALQRRMRDPVSGPGIVDSRGRPISSGSGQAPPGGYGGGGGGGDDTEGRGAGPLGNYSWKAAGAFSKSAGIVGTSLVAAAKFVDRLAGFNIRLEQAQGAATESSMGRDLSAIYEGRGPSQAAWMPERERATDLADKKQFWNAITDRTLGIVGTALVGVGVAAAPFTGGTSLALSAGGGALLANDRNRSSLYDQEAYQKLLAEQHGKDFWDSVTAFQQQDPKKKLMIDNFEKSYMQDLNAQRMLGIGNQGYYEGGGFLERVKNAGFMKEQGIGMAGDIMGAGGSSKMGNEAAFGLQMQRAGLTNASKVLGLISGGVDNNKASEEAVKRIMSRAFEEGLNNSDYAESMRRFTEVAATIVGRTGASTPQAQDALSRDLGMFLGERTNAGVSNARNAYEEFQQRGSQIGGRRGVMRYSMAMQNSNLSKLDPTELTELLAMTPEELKSDPAVLQYFTRRGGFQSSSDLLTALDGIRKNARFEIPQVRTKVQEYANTVASYMKKSGMKLSELNEKARMGGAGLPEDVFEAQGGLRVWSNTQKAQGLTGLSSEAEMGEQIKDTGILPTDTGLLDTKMANDVLNAPGDKVEDAWIRGIATSADKVRENFNNLKGVLEKSISVVGGFADQVNSKPSGSKATNNSKNTSTNTGAKDQHQGVIGDRAPRAGYHKEPWKVFGMDFGTQEVPDKK